MKKVYVLALLIAGSMGLLFSSCKTTPKQEETAPLVDQASIDELSAAIARTKAARKLAADFECPDYFPSDWESVEDRYAKAGILPWGTEEEVRDTIGVYNEITGVYEGLFDRTIPLYAQVREDEIVALRNEIKSSGLTLSRPEYLENADQKALEALAKYEAKDYYAARDAAAEALSLYKIINTGVKAYLARKEILSHEFVSYDQENFDKAEEAGQAAIAAYDKGDIKAAGSNADEALLRYNTVLNAGWAASISALETLANAARQNALSHKANVAARDIFNEAEALFQQAAVSRDAAQYRDSANMYTEAAAQFGKSARMSQEKRLLAEEAIKEAEEKMEASDDAARQAEIFIGGLK
jgi:hypothetical protein